ncbi:hypothetical protein [Nonomuraea sp. NPDC046570]|uniref:hypothetical protein n=1 Tax=Nonomuraea sp. NPDC046570 TaxID=3155255 RepID=UPI0033DB9166
MRIRDHLAQTGAPAFRFGQLIAAWQFGTGIDAACGQLHAKYLAADPTIAAPVNTELIPLTSLRS